MSLNETKEVPAASASAPEEDEALLNGSDNDEEMGGFCSRWITSKTSRLGFMLTLILGYFLAEVIVGHITNSLTLIADSFHMLSDCLSMVVALVAVRMSKRTARQSITPWPSKQQYYNTFGWVRFEVVGALINATFLLALCVSIFMEAIEKFYEPAVVTQPKLVIIVGAGGLAINLFGLVMFGSHAHGHDHGHGHGHGHGHDHGHSNHSHSHEHEHTNHEEGMSSNSTTANGIETPGDQQRKSRTSSDDQMNMRAVFLHVVGDALGSVIVIVTALVIIFVPQHEEIVVPTNGTGPSVLGPNVTVAPTSPAPPKYREINKWVLYMDPVMSLLLVVIMIITTTPLFKQSSLILLQTVPKHIELDSIRERIEEIEGVQGIHDFHIWQLAGDKLVATVHLQCKDAETYLQVAKKMKRALHDEGIHSSTLQPEFQQTSTTSWCNMQCDTDECKTKTCCDSIMPKRNSVPADMAGECDAESTSTSFRLKNRGNPYSPEQSATGEGNAPQVVPLEGVGAQSECVILDIPDGTEYSIA